jgi:hypothetical protein
VEGPWAVGRSRSAAFPIWPLVRHVGPMTVAAQCSRVTQATPCAATRVPADLDHLQPGVQKDASSVTMLSCPRLGRRSGRPKAEQDERGQGRGWG